MNLPKPENTLQINAVIFDMDGLMFDTERLAARCWKEAGHELGYEVTEEFLCGLRGQTAREYIRSFEAHFDKDFNFSALNDVRRALFWRYIDSNGVPVKPGLRELLRFLRQEGIPAALATACSEKNALRYLELTGLKDCFSTFVFGDQVSHGKPCPEIFLTAAKKLKAEPYETLVLEDSINGVQAGIAGGFQTGMIPDLCEPDELIVASLCFKFENLNQVVTYLQQIRL